MRISRNVLNCMLYERKRDGFAAMTRPMPEAHVPLLWRALQQHTLYDARRQRTTYDYSTSGCRRIPATFVGYIGA